MRIAFNIFIALLMLGTFLGASPEAHADPITVEVRTIAASTDGEGFDARLNPLKGQLTKAFRGYTSFKLEGKRVLRLKDGKSKSMPLPTGGELTLTHHGMAGDLIKLGLGLANKMSTMLRVSRGSTFFQAGLDYGSGILIVAITVN